MAKHFFALLNMKKAFQHAQEFHRYAMENGNHQTKKELLEHHVKGGNFDVLRSVRSTNSVNNK